MWNTYAIISDVYPIVNLLNEHLLAIIREECPPKLLRDMKIACHIRFKARRVIGSPTAGRLGRPC
jgi:hypothetical protein